jgi:hypothetical protein
MFFIKPLFHTHLSPPSAVCESPDRQNIIALSVFKPGGSFLTRYRVEYSMMKLFF